MTCSSGRMSLVLVSIEIIVKSAAYALVISYQGHFHFTQLLVPALLSAAQSAPHKHARIVTVSSWGHEFWPGLEYDTFSDGPARRKCSTQYLYSQSKYVCLQPFFSIGFLSLPLPTYVKGNVVVARELARRYGDQGIISISLHPGKWPFSLGR